MATSYKRLVATAPLADFDTKTVAKSALVCFMTVTVWMLRALVMIMGTATVGQIMMMMMMMSMIMIMTVIIQMMMILIMMILMFCLGSMPTSLYFFGTQKNINCGATASLNFELTNHPINQSSLLVLCEALL